ncbi:Gfo/Idh/MocA family oxidoreductase [Actinokineospora sp. NBRC 105648]|uniref:Gfo/Idh/MocA family oxidoreductase n=1 Tax=Actinokineospora sp. NBRC 105648 TaxID=3032206 RepID=UPI0024A0E1DB|nr:Gfo/Idh/MocA family oxidoreductase [Actinokineospora sp. NBRC 105648]GLZ36855.1 oxidoreductase [Actinokineospora sp. NBRC 105648]
MAVESRVAVVGFGLAGSAFHAPFIAATPGLRLTAVVTGNPERAAAATERYPGVEVLGAAEELWRRAGEFDLAVIATPNRHHVPQAKAALAAGLAVVVDKPVAGTGREVRELVEAADRAGKMLTAFQNRRWDGDFRTARELVEGGALGEVTRFESRFERAAGPVKSGWKGSTDPADLASVLYDLGSHVVDQAIALFGRPSTVTAELTGPRDEDATVLLTHTGGVRSYLRASKLTAPAAPRLLVTGPTAGYRCWGLDPQEAASRAGVRPDEPGFGVYPPAQWGQLVTAAGTETVPTQDGDYLGYYRAVGACLRGDGPPPVPLGQTVDLVDTIEAALRSSAEKSPVSL